MDLIKSTKMQTSESENCQDGAREYQQIRGQKQYDY